MSEIFFKDIANKLNLLPLRAVQFFSKVEWGDKADVNLIIYNLEAESDFKITPVTRINDRGVSILLGYKFEATLYIADNSIFDSLALLFEEMLKDRYNFNLVFGNSKAWSAETYDAPTNINSTGNLQIQLNNSNTTHIAEIEYIELRPRIKITVQSFVKSLSEISFLP